MFFSFFFCLWATNWLTCIVRRFNQALCVFSFVMLQLFGLKVSSEGCAWICSQPFDPPQTEAWMIDRWGVIIGKTATVMPIKQCRLLLPVLFLFVYQTMTIMQEAGHRCAASAQLFFFFLFSCDSVILKCICLRRNLLLLRANLRPSLRPCWRTPP